MRPLDLTDAACSGPLHEASQGVRAVLQLTNAQRVAKHRVLPWTSSARACVEEPLRGPQVVSVRSRRYNRSVQRGPNEHPAGGGDLVVVDEQGRIYLGSRDVAHLEGGLVNGSSVIMATPVRGGVAMHFTVLLSSFRDLADAREVDAPFLRPRLVPWQSPDAHNPRYEFLIRALAVTAAWIAMASEFGDVVVLDRTSGTRLLMHGAGSPVWALRVLREDPGSALLVVGTSYGGVHVVRLRSLPTGPSADIVCNMTSGREAISSLALGCELLPAAAPWTHQWKLLWLDGGEQAHALQLNARADAVEGVDSYDEPKYHMLPGAPLLSVTYCAPQPDNPSVVALCSVGGYCVVVGLEPQVQVYRCTEALNDVHVCRWNPRAPNVLAFAEVGTRLCVHVVDTASQQHQQLVVDGDNLCGLEWTADGRHLVTATRADLILLAVTPVGIALKHYLAIVTGGR